jgi:transcriptional regulator with XRE-family HTH domain
MAARLRELTPERSPRHRLGAVLRHHRLRMGLSQDALGRIVFVSADLVRKVEHATRFPSGALAARLDTVLSADGAIVAAWLEADRQPSGRRTPTGENFSAERETPQCWRTATTTCWRCGTPAPAPSTVAGNCPFSCMDSESLSNLSPRS